jgi:hypothetical protein
LTLGTSLSAATPVRLGTKDVRSELNIWRKAKKRIESPLAQQHFESSTMVFYELTVKLMLILMIIVRLSNAQYSQCFLCGREYVIAYPSSSILFQDGTTRTCAVIESQALNGLLPETYCFSYASIITATCGCREVQAPMAQQSPSMSPTFSEESAPPAGSTSAPTRQQRITIAPFPTGTPSTMPGIWKIIGYILGALGALLAAGLVGIGCMNFYNYGTMNCVTVNFFRRE